MWDSCWSAPDFIVRAPVEVAKASGGIECGGLEARKENPPEIETEPAHECIESAFFPLSEF